MSVKNPSINFVNNIGIQNVQFNHTHKFLFLFFMQQLYKMTLCVQM